MSWILIVTLVAALAGGGGTVYASNRALPGDVLYPVKSTVEDLRLVVSDQDQHVGLYRRYAGTRVQELERLIRSQRVDEVPVALERFERHMQGAMAALDEVSGDDPEQAERLALELRQDLAFYRAELNRLVESTPERARPVVERAAVDLSEGQTQLNALFPGDPDDRQTVTDDDRDHDDDEDEDAEVEGVVEAIDHGALTLTVAGMTFRADADTKIEHVGAFDQIQGGDRVKVEYRTSDNYAFEIEVKETDQDDDEDAEVEGVVEAIDQGALTLTVAGMTFWADAGTEIEHVGAFDQIQVGDRVKVEYSTSDNYAF
jgi:hypothetical protein